MRHGDLHLSYCTNVHPGEGLDALERIVEEEVCAVKARVSPQAPLGTGLRVGHAAAAELRADPERLAALAERLRARDLYVFTLNGFPYGDFARPGLKQAVYAPDWSTPERLAYTLDLAEVLARLPGPDRRTISTVSGGFKPQDDHQRRAQMLANLRAAARGLEAIAERSGVHIRLCLEPEPWTSLETTSEAIALFDELRDAPDHLGLCYDCCHQAVHFEDPAESVRALVEAEVPIGKVQVSSALHLARPSEPEARAALLAFDEACYLHQTVARTQTGLLRALDLPELRDPSPEWLEAEAWRTHFHVPIWWSGAGHLSTTRADWQAAVRAVVEHGACEHLEIETYSWAVIPAAERAGLGDLQDCVAREFEALLDCL